MKRGYLALYRKIQDHPFYRERREFSKYEAWVDLLMEAQHEIKPQEVVLGMKTLICNYGESLKSLRTWADRWKWSEPKVRRYFSLLKKMNQICSKSEVITTRVTILNYSQYDPKRRTGDAQATHECSTDKHVNHDKNSSPPAKPAGRKQLFTENDLKGAKYLLARIAENSPHIKTPNINQWADTIRLIRERDGKTEIQITDAINFATTDDFWQDNILSATSLRKQMDKLLTLAEKRG